MEGKKVKKFFQSDKFGHVNVFILFFFLPYKFVQTPVFLMLPKSISVIKGKRLFFQVWKPK